MRNNTITIYTCTLRFVCIRLILYICKFGGSLSGHQKQKVGYFGFEEIDGNAVVLQKVDSQLASAPQWQFLVGDELQQTDQNYSGFKFSIDVSQLQFLLQEIRTVSVTSQT